ncbi:HNH endonuclease signature motif containing protein [Sanguibacter gelidistatuariae]|uniref:HNH endonuclease signature motif containing protein n=1 Tax=Sanguibacter gelidistatuariae TaxID=1814289 RepID=UPI001588137F|nr:HNH endonuclease signature motif containing protein [Sanguibacter gelidistatuariae]
MAVSSRARCGRIVELDRSIAVLTAERASLLVAERDCGEWKKAGYASFEAWRGQMSGEGLRAARAQVTVATVLEESPEAAEAVATGEVTMVHAEILGRVRAKAERPGTPVLTPSENRELLDLAKGQDADTFAKTADRWWARRDSLAHDATHEETRRKRFLTISHTPTGTYIKGFLDVVAGRQLDAAVEAAMHRPADGDDRDYSQRKADALVDVADRAMSGGSFKNGAAVRPHVSIIMTEDTLAQGVRELRRRATVAEAEAQGPGADQSAGQGEVAGEGAGEGTRDGATSASVQFEPATFEDGTPVPLSEVARILCDADLTRIVMTADNVPINLGRTQRLYTREQRRAIIARDRGCQFTGCTQPIPWCEIHHIDWWTNGGETSLDNAILLCSFHHHEVHRLNLTIDRNPNPAGRPGGTRTVRVARGGGRVTRTPGPAECRVAQAPTALVSNRRTPIESRPPTADQPLAADRPSAVLRPPAILGPPTSVLSPSRPRPPGRVRESAKTGSLMQVRPPVQSQPSDKYRAVSGREPPGGVQAPNGAGPPGDRRASGGNGLPSQDQPLGFAYRGGPSSRSPGKKRWPRAG